MFLIENKSGNNAYRENTQREGKKDKQTNIGKYNEVHQVVVVFSAVSFRCVDAIDNTTAHRISYFMCVFLSLSQHIIRDAAETITQIL